MIEGKAGSGERVERERKDRPAFFAYSLLPAPVFLPKHR